MIRTGPSTPRRLVRWDRAHRLDSQTAALRLAIDMPWLLYTPLYFWLYPRRATIAPSLFMHQTVPSAIPLAEASKKRASVLASRSVQNRA